MSNIVGDAGIAQVASLAQSQYFNRPADERYEDLDTLEAAVVGRRNRSLEYESQVDTFAFSHTDADGVLIMTRQGEAAKPTHYAFGQTAGLLKAPADYLRRLGAAGQHELVARNLNASLGLRAKDGNGREKALVIDPLGDGLPALAALTSPTYGRIWDADVLRKLVRPILNSHPEFHNPLEWGGKRGGLYASDRDIFLFYIDGGSIVDGGADLRSGGDRDQLHRGFMVWNSEVGSATMGIAAFLFRMVCGNHMIHGIEGTKLLKIRHTSGGPERFVTEAIPALREYVKASAKPVETAVRAAKQYLLPAATDEEKFLGFFKTKGFTAAEVRRAKTFAEQEEGGAETLWQMQQGFTRAARDLAFMDARTDLEKRAGKLLELVAEPEAA